MSRNPIRHTVENFIPRNGARRELREWKKFTRTAQKKDPPKSNFVRFMESLQNRGHLSMNSPYESWTEKVRRDMEKEGTWPRRTDRPTASVLAEYWSRIQREFWIANEPILWYEWYKGSSDPAKLTHIKTLRLVYEKIRHKGMRDRSFQLPRWQSITPAWTHIHPIDPRGRHLYDESTDIWPFTEFNNHGVDI